MQNVRFATDPDLLVTPKPLLDRAPYIPSVQLAQKITMARTKKTAGKNRALAQLTHGRPPLAPKPKAKLSKEATQKLIRNHHDLNKKLAKAKAKGEDDKAKAIEAQINEAGGLRSYQTASLLGQSQDRGGDSSAVLVEWLKDFKAPLKTAKQKLKMLEVGALSVDNACSKSGLFTIERIDLNSQGDGIKQQDFMERPLPHHDEERFDIISLSLVVNYVPTEKARGDMLKRTCDFLDLRASRDIPKELQPIFPTLFLVLPAACVTNSRYFNDERLTRMMDSLGYVMLKRKQTDKLIYYLWLLRDKPVVVKQNFPKEIIRPGGKRNNFAIVLGK